MKKITDFIKKNYLFCLLGIPLIYILINLKAIDNDTWWLLNNGKYILHHGIFYIDPFSIHEGLHVVLQQWLFSLIIWIIYSWGEIPLIIFMFIMAVIFEIIYYKLCYTVSKNKTLSIFLTLVFMMLFKEFFTLRPQIFTYLSLIIDLLLLEKYALSDNKKYLYALPFISLIMINMHASMWIMQFLFIGTFIVNAMVNQDERKDKYRLKPLIIVAIIMFMVGFINPYGYKSVLYLLFSYGGSSSNLFILEMLKPTFATPFLKCIIITIVLFMYLICFIKEYKIDIRHFFLLVGLFVFAFMYYKSMIYYCLVFPYIFAYGFRDVTFNIKEISKKWLKLLISFSKCILMISIIIAVAFFFRSTVKKYDYHNDYEETFDYIIDNYDKDEVVLYANYNNGGYAEFRGIKPYIDARAEVYMKKFNKKADILEESFSLNEEYLEKFIDKYHFTHFLIDDDDYLFKNYLSKSEEYELVYTQCDRHIKKACVSVGYVYARVDNEENGS